MRAARLGRLARLLQLEQTFFFFMAPLLFCCLLQLILVVGCRLLERSSAAQELDMPPVASWTFSLFLAWRFSELPS